MSRHLQLPCVSISHFKVMKMVESEHHHLPDHINCVPVFGLSNLDFVSVEANIAPARNVGIAVDCMFSNMDKTVSIYT